MATKATVNSRAYVDKILSLNGSLNVHQIACPAIVPLIEEGIINNEIMDLTFIRELRDGTLRHRDFAFYLDQDAQYLNRYSNIARLYPGVRMFSSSEEVATAVRMELESRGMLAEEPGRESTFYASDLSENFVNMISRILGKDSEELNIRFKNLDI